MKQLSFSSREMRGDPVPAGRKRVPLAPRRLRLLEIAFFFLVWLVVICSRLVWLQVVRRAEFVERADRQQQRTFEVAPRRGVLYDRNLHELAMTVLADSVYAVPSEIAARQDPDSEAKYRAAANALARVVHRDPENKFTSAQQIAARLIASKSFAWVARKLDPNEIAEVKALKLKGVYFQPEFKRFYPNSDLAAQVLGYVGTDDTGLGGLEREFDRDLHGVPGRMLTALDARRHVLGSQERDPQPGKNLVLTIDENIQFIAERALDAALQRTHALNGTIVVQDPNTGQILALAMRPTFNPNDFRHSAARLLRDHAVSDVYEPGSTFKLVTYSTALDQGVAKPDDKIDCQGGQITLAGRVIHDDQSDRGLGVVSVATALARSSDVAAVKLALKVGPDHFYQTIRSFGFGSRSGIELPAETRGLLRPPNRWSGSSIGSIAIGQEVAVTPIQLATMVSTLANGGVYLPPHILLERTEETPAGNKLMPAAFHPGAELPDPLPDGAHRVVSTTTAAEMRKMMEGVVLNGTGKNAQLDGYSAGGKTGTAQKIDLATHRYSKTKHVASFVGIAPISKPAITVVVVIDSPEGAYYGAEVAAPVFKEVAQQVLEYLGVPHDQQLKPQSPDLEQAQREVEPPANQFDDLDVLFDAANHLPPDDPLRAEVIAQQTPPAPTDAPSDASSDAPSGPAHAADSQATPPLPPFSAKPTPEILAQASAAASLAPTRAPSSRVLKGPTAAQSNPPSSTQGVRPAVAEAASPGVVVVDAQRRVAVPSFVGEPVRQAVESAAALGLNLQILGSGIAREQVPEPGTMVPLGTGVVIRFNR